MCARNWHGCLSDMVRLNASEVITARSLWLNQSSSGSKSRACRPFILRQYIAPGCPWQNAYAESFHSRFRAECLDRQWFHTVREAAVVVEAWRRYYNQERLHSSLDYVPPDEFERSWHLARQHQLSHNTAILPL